MQELYSITYIKIEELENKLEKKLKRNEKVLGLDTASKSGWCIAKTNDEELELSVGVINVTAKNRYLKYNYYVDIFKNLIKSEYFVVIEDTFLKMYKSKNKNAIFANVWTLKLLTFIGAIAYTISRINKCKQPKIRNASHARKLIGLNSKAKKPILVKKINKLLNTEFKNNNIVDAIILALGGLIEETNKKENGNGKKTKKFRK